jgi:hypothetical protein
MGAPPTPYNSEGIKSHSQMINVKCCTMSVSGEKVSWKAKALYGIQNEEKKCQTIPKASCFIKKANLTTKF